MSIIHIYCDGCGPRKTASGPAMGIGVLAMSEDEIVFEHSELVLHPDSTNNLAELLAMKVALEQAIAQEALGNRNIVFCDSTFTIAVTLSGTSTQKKHLVSVCSEVVALFRKTKATKIAFVQGERNLADYYSRKPFGEKPKSIIKHGHSNV